MTALSEGYTLSEDVFQYLASELTEDVRQLKSGLIGVSAKSIPPRCGCRFNLGQKCGEEYYFFTGKHYPWIRSSAWSASTMTFA